MFDELGRTLVMVALHGGLLNRAVYAFSGFVGSRLGRLGHAVFHTVFAADTVEAVSATQELIWLRRELHPVVGQ